MRRQEAREILKMLDVLQAFADGKEIEFLGGGCVDWRSGGDMLAFTLPASCYRIKAEPKYRPFRDGREAEPAIVKCPWVRLKSDDGTTTRDMITSFNDRGCFLYYNASLTPWDEMLGRYEFIDGTPFGVLVE